MLSNQWETVQKLVWFLKIYFNIYPMRRSRNKPIQQNFQDLLKVVCCIYGVKTCRWNVIGWKFVLKILSIIMYRVSIIPNIYLCHLQTKASGVTFVNSIETFKSWNFERKNKLLKYPKNFWTNSVLIWMYLYILDPNMTYQFDFLKSSLKFWKVGAVVCRIRAQRVKLCVSNCYTANIILCFMFTFSLLRKNLLLIFDKPHFSS